MDDYKKDQDCELGTTCTFTYLYLLTTLSSHSAMRGKVDLSTQFWYQVLTERSDCLKNQQVTSKLHFSLGLQIVTSPLLPLFLC